MTTSKLLPPVKGTNPSTMRVQSFFYPLIPLLPSLVPNSPLHSPAPYTQPSWRSPPNWNSPVTYNTASLPETNCHGLQPIGVFGNCGCDRWYRGLGPMKSEDSVLLHIFLPRIPLMCRSRTIRTSYGWPGVYFSPTFGIPDLR